MIVMAFLESYYNLRKINLLEIKCNALETLNEEFGNDSLNKYIQPLILFFWYMDAIVMFWDII